MNLELLAKIKKGLINGLVDKFVDSNTINITRVVFKVTMSKISPSYHVSRTF